MNEGLPNFYTLGPLPEIVLGSLHIPTYYLIISLTYCAAILWFYKRCESRNLSQQHALDISFILLVFGFLGARLTHILFEMPQHYLESPIEVFYVWQGGFVFYGGALTGYLFAFLYIRQSKLTFWLWHDTIAPVLAMGYAVGRIACYLVGCCYGKICHLPWAISVTQVDTHSNLTSQVLRHPTQLYATGFELCTLAFLIWYEKRKPKLGHVFLYWVTLHSLGRLIMEFFRDDPRGPNLLGLSISSVISILLLTTSLVLLKKKT